MDSFPETSIAPIDPNRIERLRKGNRRHRNSLKPISAGTMRAPSHKEGQTTPPGSMTPAHFE